MNPWDSEDFDAYDFMAEESRLLEELFAAVNAMPDDVAAVAKNIVAKVRELGEAYEAYCGRKEGEWLHQKGDSGGHVR